MNTAQRLPSLLQWCRQCRLPRTTVWRRAIGTLPKPSLLSLPHHVPQCTALNHTPQCAALYTTQAAPRLNDESFHTIADETMETLINQFENEDALADMDEFDVHYADGVLTLALGTHGTYVINKQPPNHEIWLSSPTSGPKRFDWDPTRKNWIAKRTGIALDALLTEELSTLAQAPSLKIDLAQ